MPTTMPTVSVIVPTFRDSDGLRRTLRALETQTYPADQMEILVADNTPEFALNGEPPGGGRVRLLHAPRPGSYAARNRALDEARGDILCFTDADCEPAPDWIERGVAALAAAGGDALIAGRIESFAQNPARPTPIEVLELLTAFPQRAYAERQQFGATANVVTTRRVVATAGAFDDRIASGGDREFGQRVHRAGFPVVYAEAVLVRHPARRTLRAFLAKRRRTIGGVLALERPGELLKGRFAKGLLSDVRPPLQTSLLLLRQRELGPWLHRLRAVPVLWYTRYYSAAYRLAAVARHALGRRARTTEQVGSAQKG